VAWNLQLDEGAHFRPAAKQFSLQENGEKDYGETLIFVFSA
jgi:hypothetical protein